MYYLFCLVLALLPLAAHAASLHLSNVFGSSMVLQRGKPIPVWGWTDAGAAVTASFTGLASNASATADAKGFFKVVFPAQPATLTPVEIVVCAAAGAACASLSDVLVGDVVLCSGQSNTEFNVASSNNASAEIAAAELYPLIRVTSGPLQGQFNLHDLPIGVVSQQLLAVDLPWSHANATSIGGNGKGWE
jgi:sialate O-acetylesterase